MYKHPLSRTTQPHYAVINVLERHQNRWDHWMLSEEWLANWKIKFNEQKCKHVTLTLPQTYPAIKLNGISIPQANDVTYLGLDRRLTWKNIYVDTKILQMNLKAASLNWLSHNWAKTRLQSTHLQCNYKEYLEEKYSTVGYDLCNKY